ncbi:MAG TPA: multidrug efflux RND transporter permease subunit [Syntrophorhabdaceae bacterium]|nr:multidrug efflux RND transporter permease subunit [Syntrophorhabdaceae bacterium]HNZ59080.1 multidrug efflux RND transporter permease subunit [Syntrophorhabdaceae bacterium]HOB69386.1 multidrug efflux RND transporter permease subunit [Syntrophorhabdaceae bacterium]HOF57811.1 multidrug efflux RND transporter permease subunit [Syntrophorhabdaceae bacterium]HOG40224.1 multidrug efflux RND transporter permease subunit [Syntrophorhabdaceae bacterium]
MAKFFINRPIVAMVISILMVIVGIVAMAGLPVAQFPSIVPPEIQVQTTYLGADALTVEQAVATPLEQQINGVDNMLYMYSINANNGQMNLRVAFDVSTDPNIDQVLTQMRQEQAQSQLPKSVRRYGITNPKSLSSPLMLVTLYSPKGTYDATFLANYAYININDPLTRTPGVGQVQVFGAGQYAMRIWMKPDQLAKLEITATDIWHALNVQNKVNPVGQIGAEPVPKGQEFTYTLKAQGRMITEEEFGNIIVRAKPDGSIVRIKDVAKVELGSQMYNIIGRMNGAPAAILAIYQLPGSNAIDAAKGVKKLLEDMKKRFPQDLDYKVSLDTTLAVTEGIKEIVTTLWEAVLLVIFVVFIFLQGWRATLIPLVAVPVSLIGTFAVFPLLGFSINTLSLFGLVLAIGLVVDDAIVVVEAVEHHIEEGMSPRDATIKAMDEVSGPVVAIALILAAVFVPTAFIPGITGRLYQQFAVTIAVSMLLSAFNALSLSPALAAMLLRPKEKTKGVLGTFFGGFNRLFARATDGYVGICAFLIKKAKRSLLFLLVVGIGVVLFGAKLPSGFLPEEDQGYFYLDVQLPDASSLQRLDATCKKIEDILKNTPGVQVFNTIVGYSTLSQVNTTYNAYFSVTLKPWHERKKKEERYSAIMAHVNQELSKIPSAQTFAFSPPAIPGIGTSGGITFMLEDRAGKGIDFLAENLRRFLDEARKRPEFASINTSFSSNVPQIYANIDKSKVLKQGVNLGDVYQTLQAFMGGPFVNYFNRFGRQWQVYALADGDYRTKAENIKQFYVRNNSGQMVPLNTLVTIEQTSGPEFTLRYNEYRAAQINVIQARDYSSQQAMSALEDVFHKTMPTEMGFDYMGMSYQQKVAVEGISPTVIFGLSLLFVFLILAAQYESWSLPFSVLLGTPIAVMGAFLGLLIRGFENNVYAQIGLVMLIGLAAKNAILIVEFAKTKFEEGDPIVKAALDGARLRLRPILMTAFAFILGTVPLAIASGSGAISRQILGTVVIGGMLAATLIAIFLIPVTFYVVEKFVHKESKDIKVPLEIPATQSPEGTGDRL